MPPLLSPSDYYCPGLMAADPTNHSAVAVQDSQRDEQVDLAVYTADSQGDQQLLNKRQGSGWRPASVNRRRWKPHVGERRRP